MGQSVQVSMSVAPELVEYLPAPQSVHTSPEVAPGEPEYLPAAQSVLHSHTHTHTHKPLIVSATTQGVTRISTDSLPLAMCTETTGRGSKKRVPRVGDRATTVRQ